MNVRHLAVFRAVIKTGSVSSAARLLSVTQPAITKTLQQIEYEVGLPLFKRIKGRLRPTSESMLLMSRVDQVFGAVDEVERMADELSGRHGGQISIATVSTLGASIVTSAIENFKMDWPNTKIVIRGLTTRQVVEDVASNLVDFGIVDAAPTESNLVTEPMCRAYLGVIVPKGHRLSGNSAISMTDLAGEQIITFLDNTASGIELRRRLDALRPQTRVSISVSQSVIACALVNEGVGVGVIDPFTALSGIFSSTHIAKLEPEMKIEPRIIFPPKRTSSNAADAFARTVRETFSDYVSASDLLEPM